jgi:CDP-Glycerol:Poly(glycerophosphate) glycerophosphotransferase.
MAHVKYVNILHALTKDWDLILYVNHPWGFAAWFAPFLKKIYINHGLYAGKINNAHGEDGVYGRRRTTRPHRGLLYDRMFAASKREQDAAIEANPALAGRVVVTGSLIVDEMKVDSVDRESTRARLGLQPDDCVVHVVSTWGKASLAATMEDTLLAAASNLGAPYRFLFSLHPRFDKLGGTGKARNEILKRWASKGFEIDEANERWRQFVIASDVAIADHSSLALYHHVLGKPVIYVRVEGKALLHGSPFHLLGKRSRYFSGDDDLRAVISEAIAKTDAVSVDIDNLVDHVGNAGVRHLQEMQKLLRS